MTRQECRERDCPFFDEDIGCEILNEEGLTLDDAESCVGMKVYVDDDE